MSPQRREKILALLRENGSVTLRELEAVFPGLSTMTLRRDLDFFENIGVALRVRGGARYIKEQNGAQEDIYELRKIKNLHAKERIASTAVTFAEQGRSIFIDSGTTAMCLARLLPDAPLAILTSGPNVAVEVSAKFKPAVTLIGGLINRSSLSVSGMQAIEFIKDFNIDVAFMVASAFSAQDGFTCGNMAECELKRAIAAKAKKTIMLADCAKAGKSMPFTFARMDDIDILITECEPPADIIEAALGKATILW